MDFFHTNRLPPASPGSSAGSAVAASGSPTSPVRLPAVTFNELEKAVNRSKKIRRITEEEDTLLFEVIAGVGSGQASPLMLVTEWRVQKTAEALDFAKSPAVIEKLYRPEQRGIVLVDVASYSNFPTVAQAGILVMLDAAIRDACRLNDLFSPPSIDRIIPTGDGCYLVFKETARDHVLFAAFNFHACFCSYQRRIRKGARCETGEGIQLRIAAHIGEVDWIEDPAGNRNSYGTGLNETARILDAGRSKLIDDTGTDPSSVVFYDSALDPQAKSILERVREAQMGQTRHSYLGEVKAKHDLVLDLRCFTGLPSHEGFSFASPHPDIVAPSRVFLP